MREGVVARVYAVREDGAIEGGGRRRDLGLVELWCLLDILVSRGR